MLRPLPYLVIFLLPGLVFTAASFNDWRMILPVLIAHILLPGADHLVGRRRENLDKSTENTEQARAVFSWILRAYVPVQLALTIWLVLMIPELDWPVMLGLALALGISNGAMGINISHELIHRQNKLDPFLGRLLLLCCCYTHWAVEHVRGHHRLVATPEDPATARRGQTLYAFWWQSLSGTMRSGWKLEADRLHRQNRSSLSYQNEVLRWWVLQILIIGAIAIWLGPVALAFFLGQSVIAILELENVNYIEHYGLQRARLSNGQYEPVRPQHSWNADYRMTGWFLIELGRHSDHHANARRHFQILRSFPDAPLMPTGYGGMVALAMVPPLWFRVMNKKLAEWEATYSPEKGQAVNREAG